jgi:ribonuclease HI
MLITSSNLVGCSIGTSITKVAEYPVLIAVLEWFTQRELFDADMTIRGDSLLAIQQMFGAWKIKKGIYTPLAYKARGLRTQFTKYAGRVDRQGSQPDCRWAGRLL